MRTSRYRRGTLAVITGLLCLAVLASSGSAFAQAATGPLRVHPTNPRYFANAQGTAVYLTGSHTWGAMHDLWTSTYAPFDWNQHVAGGES